MVQDLIRDSLKEKLAEDISPSQLELRYYEMIDVLAKKLE